LILGLREIAGRAKIAGMFRVKATDETIIDRRARPKRAATGGREGRVASTQTLPTRPDTQFLPRNMDSQTTPLVVLAQNLSLAELFLEDLVLGVR
jgi:hypothetical protein